MKNTEQIQSLSIQELVLGTQAAVHKNCQIHFRVDEHLKELIGRCIKERNLSGETEFFTRLALDYFGRIGWMERKRKEPQYLSAEDLGMTEEECNIATRKTNYYKKSHAR